MSEAAWLTRRKRIDTWLRSLNPKWEIVQRVEGLFAPADQIEARLRAAQRQVDTLTPSLLARAFRGEFVPRDPNDEPASVLLERINTAGDGAPPTSSGARKRRHA
jgi:type I restriction enzyme S subunit